MSENIKQEHIKDSVKRDRFVRVAESRVNKILYNLDNLGKCANRRSYEYSDEEVRKIFREIDRKIREVKYQFQETQQKQGKFHL